MIKTRLGPHNIESEEAVLGSILINPEAMNLVSDFLEPEYFFELKHAWIFQTMLDMKARGDAIDNLTLESALRDSGKIEDVGGPAYITYLINSTPTHIYVETYGHIVERAAIRRRILAAAGDIAQTAREKNAELDTIIAECNALLNEATHRGSDKPGMVLADAASQYLDKVEAISKAPDGNQFGYPSGLWRLDGYLHSFKRGGLYLIAARPAVGKTTLLLNIARNMVKRGAKTQFFSLEMARDEIVEKVVSAETKIPSDKFAEGKLSGDEWSAFTSAIDAFDTLPLFIEDSSTLTPSKLRTFANRQQREYGLDAVFVDYIQLMTPDRGERRKNGTKNDELASISLALKQLARELNVPVIAACQLNRAGVVNPGLEHLRDSGALEADADGVILLSSQAGDLSTLKCNLAKHRHGATGTVDLFYSRNIHNIACKLGE
jgi:replicative DNA helicase